MIISAARLSACAASPWRARSATSTLPSASQATTTTFIPAMTAEAGLVPWAETGMRQTSRCASPRCCVIVADGEQARIFALAAGVGLQRDRVEAGDLGEHRLELLEELLVALRLLERREGMHEGEARAR